MRGKISKRSVDALQTSDGDTLMWDTDIPGFGVRCRESGAKFYVLKFRAAGRRQRWVTIGRHGAPWTPDEARREALRLLGEVVIGHDPADRKHKKNYSITVADLCDQYLAAAPTLILPKKGRPKKASSLATDRSNIERHIKPLLGRSVVRAVTTDDVEQIQRDIAAGKTATDVKTRQRGRAIVRGGKGTAARSVSLLGAIFSYAVKQGIRSGNPVSGVTLYRGPAKERYLSASELARLGEALESAEKRGENLFAVAAIRLLVLTGARKSEILGLRWEEVDSERGYFRLPDSKTDQRTIPLGAPALQLLANLPREDGNPHVLPSFKGSGHLVGLQKIWNRIRFQADLSDVRLHDLRHSFASVAVAGGDSLYLVSKVLGHRQSRTTEGYAHLADDPVRAVANRASEQISAAMSARDRDEANVVDLKYRTR